MAIHTVIVGFDPHSNGFSFGGMEATPEGYRLDIPYDTNPAEIHFVKDNSEAPWSFRQLDLRGPTGAPLILVNAWRTITANESFPLSVIAVPGTILLEVQSFADDKIVVLDTNGATQVNIGIRFRITVEDTSPTGGDAWWTSPDPQVVNEIQSGGGLPR